MKALMPTLKEKKRYLVFELISDSDIKDFKLVETAINEAVLSFIGLKGNSEAGVNVLENKYSKEKQKGIIRVNNKFVHDIKTALSFVKTIGKQQASFKIIGVSGILKKADEKYIG